MEDEAAASATVHYKMEYKESPGIAERLTASVPELSRVQETNMDLTANASPTRQHSAASKLPTLMSTRTCPTSQHPASELPTLIPRDSESSTQLVSTEQSPKSKYGNWRRGLEIGTLTTIILTIWMLFSVPTFFYALPPQIREVS